MCASYEYSENIFLLNKCSIFLKIMLFLLLFLISKDMLFAVMKQNLGSLEFNLFLEQYTNFRFQNDFSGFNEWKRKRKAAPTLSSENLKLHSQSIFRFVSRFLCKKKGMEYTFNCKINFIMIQYMCLEKERKLCCLIILHSFSCYNLRLYT